MTGDPFQIDSPYLDANSNGLTYLVEAFKGQSIYGHIALEKSERSPLGRVGCRTPVMGHSRNYDSVEVLVLEEVKEKNMEVGFCKSCGKPIKRITTFVPIAGKPI
jgi:hypothetical protein